MNKELRDKIKEWNKIKYGDNSDRIIIYTLKSKEAVTIAPNIKE